MTLAQTYNIEPVRENILAKKVSTFWSLAVIILAAVTVVILGKTVLDAAIDDITNTYGPVHATPCAEEYFEYEINEKDGEQFVTVTGYHGTLREVNIPAEINGIKVKQIARFAFMSNDIVYIIRIPEGVTFIGNMCFFNCPSLRRVYIPESASDIGGWCFGKTEDITVEGVNGSYAQEYSERAGLAFEGYSYKTES